MCMVQISIVLDFSDNCSKHTANMFDAFSNVSNTLNKQKLKLQQILYKL